MDRQLSTGDVGMIAAFFVALLLFPAIVLAAPGDSGTMVPNAKNAILPTARTNLGFGPAVSIMDYGADSTGATSSSAAFISCITSGHDCRIPAGTYLLSCGVNYVATASITIFGDSMFDSTLRLPSACARGTNPLIRKANIRDITIDANGATAAANTSIILPSDPGNLSPVIVRTRVINATTHTFLILLQAAAIAVVDPVIEQNYLSLTAADTTDNNCILFNRVSGGTITGGSVSFNRCVNTSIALDGLGTRAIGNDVSGWNFGSGLGSYASTGSGDYIIADNQLHDSGTALDVNSTLASGIETWGPGSTIIGNKCWNTGGECISSGGQRSVVIGNWAYGVNKHNSAGIGAFQARYIDATFNGSNSLFANNWARDDGGGTQYYGYVEQSSSLTGIRLLNNDFDGNITATVNLASTSGTVFDEASVGTFIVSALPGCAAARTGAKARVSDATAPTYNGALTGTGSVVVPVYCDGTSWKSH